MSRDDFEADRSLTADDGDAALPPVQPPSAGFIVQLFVVPALIVLAVVGVWALFGKIASSDEDWREMVEDIRNTNEHRRWRGANGLATLLVRDQQLGDDGQHLASNPEIARVLVGLFEEGLNRHSQREDDLKQEAFLARTLGLLDSQATVLPALQHGMKPEQDREIRKNSIASIAVIAGRADERHEAVNSPSLVEDLVAATSDSDSLIRDTGTYALGLVSTPASRDRLAVLVTAGRRQHASERGGRPGTTEIDRGTAGLQRDSHGRRRAGRRSGSARSGRRAAGAQERAARGPHSGRPMDGGPARRIGRADRSDLPQSCRAADPHRRDRRARHVAEELTPRQTA